MRCGTVAASIFFCVFCAASESPDQSDEQILTVEQANELVVANSDFLFLAGPTSITPEVADALAK